MEKTVSGSQVLNLICPRCQNALPKEIKNLLHNITEASIENTEKEYLDPQTFLFKCPYCQNGINLEDASIMHLRRLSGQIWVSAPLSIGGYVESGIVDVEPGTIHKIDTEGLEDTEFEELKIAQYYLPDEADQSGSEGAIVPGGDSVIKDNCVFNMPYAEDDLLVISCTPLEGTGSADLPETISIGYSYTVIFSKIRDPPWIDLLQRGVMAAMNEEHVAALPLLISAFDNHLHRQIHYTMSVQGKSESEISDLIADCSYGGKPRWKQLVKNGLEKITGTNIASHESEYHTVFQEYMNVRELRDESIIHVGSDEEVIDMTGSDFSYVDAVINMIVAVWVECYNTRYEAQQ